MSYKLTEKAMLKGVEKMNSFGPRYTGSEAHRNYIDYLKKEAEKLGYRVHSDPFYFKRWQALKSSLTVFGETEIGIPVSSVHPYSGKTDEDGITAELCYVKTLSDVKNLKGKIAVFEVSNIDFVPSEIAFDKRTSYPENALMEAKYEGPVITTFVKFVFGMIAKAGKAAAAVFVWKNLHDDCVEGQYLPFILEYQNLPILWVNQTNGRTLIKAAEEKKKARLVLQAEIEENAYTESFYCIKEGTEKGESVVINTHTDGPNCVEENGPVAILEIMKALKDVELSRTHIFVFTTGHFRLPSFKALSTGSFQSASRWMAMHRQLWDGKHGHLKCVANLTLEHLGCLEWRTVDGEYKYTGKPDLELVYTGNKVMDKLYIDTVKERETVRTMTLRGHNMLHFGEGQNFFTMGVPGICMVPAPYYLCAESESHEMEKFSPELMLQQTETFLKLISKIENMSADTLGRSEGYSFVKSKSVSGGYDFSLKGLKGVIADKVKK